MRSNQAAVAKNSEREVFISRLKSVVETFGSNSALAREIGSAESTIRRWLAGMVEPKYDSLVAISNAANVSLEWLMTGKGEMRSSLPPAPISNGEKEGIYAEQAGKRSIIVKWDNMEPTIYAGDEIGIESVTLNPCEITSGIYLLKMGDAKGVWRIQSAADKKIWLLNDNPKYQKVDTAIDLSEARDIKIEAKVLWVRHNF